MRVPCLGRSPFTDFAILCLTERLNKICKNYFATLHFVIVIDSFYINLNKDEFR